MGDQCQILIQDRDSKVFLYSHWDGYKIDLILKNALIRGESRWDDPPYLTRIIFCEMIRGDVMGVIGYGISSVDQDGPITRIWWLNNELMVDDVKAEDWIK